MDLDNKLKILVEADELIKKNTEESISEAISLYSKILGEEPYNAAVHGAIARAYLSLNQIDMAEIYAGECHLLEKDNSEWTDLETEISESKNDFPAHEKGKKEENLCL